MPVHSRRYFQLIEKDSANVNPLWKVFHALLFILIGAMSFCSAFTFHDIFESFSFRCILYGKPVVHLTDIVYNITTTTATTTELTPTEGVSTLTTITPTTPEMTLRNESESDTVTESRPEEEESSKKETLKIEIIEDVFWMSNSTFTARVAVDHRKTVYGSKGVCNAVLFFPLATLIFGTFGAVIVIICGRGGRGYRTDLFPQPWLYVYPLLILSTIMLIINLVLATWLNQGMHQFCSAFKEYTGQESCSEKINYFTDGERFGFYNLFYIYNLCALSFFIGIILWALQVALMVMRVLCIADFQLVMVTVSCKRRRSLGLEDVHKALTKSHKLKKVDKTDTKKHKDDDVTQV